ncbi:MAG: MarR family winged helix-turn-helix transcriptional regulator [Christensenellales bacterium]|jgi:DNA-binding MarR family transcriptional regulator
MTSKNNALIEQMIEKINRIKMYHRSEDAKQQGGRGTGFVLTYLYYHGNQALPSELGQKMNVSTPRVTAILNELEARGLITRSISPEDRRNINVMLSDKGRQVVEERLSKQRKSIQLLVERLDEADVKAFLRVLDVLDSLMEERGCGI